MRSLQGLLPVLCLVILVAASGQAASQNAAPAAPTAVASAEIALDEAQAEIERLTRGVTDKAGDDDALADLKVSAEGMTRMLLDVGVSFRPVLNDVKARIDALGPAPAEGEPAEPASVAEQRKSLAAERALINALTGRAEAISVQAGTLGDRITDIRRDLFTSTLFNRTEIDTKFFVESAAAYRAELVDFNRTLGSWFKFVWSFKAQALLASLFLSLLAALFFVAGGYRLFGGLIVRDPVLTDPPYINRLSVAFWSTAIPTMGMLAVAISTSSLLTSFAVLRGDIAPMIMTLLAVSVVVSFVIQLARAILAPRHPDWRLLKVSNAGARHLVAMIALMALVNGADYVLGSVSRALGSPVVLTVAKSFVAAIIIGLILVLISRLKPMLASSGDPKEPGTAWPRLISVSLLLSGLALPVMALMGYVGLARFASTQIIVTGAVLAAMYIGFLSGHAVLQPGAFARTSMGRYIDRKMDPGQIALDQAGLAAGLLIYFGVLLVGLPLIFMQWGFQIADIRLWLVRVLTDIRVGGITISLTGILIGVLMFIGGLFATRWFQKWLDGNVMARGRVDMGVRNSVRTGIGYLGIGVAALIAISAAGIDLSSLALVAGALSLGIGFGLQNIVSNFVSGLILLAERPFKVGDWVVTGTTEGFVKKISVRATEIETFQRQTIIVPNSELINASVGNWTHRNNLGRADIAIGVGYESDPRKVMAILMEIALAHDKVLRTPEPLVHFVSFGDSSLNFELKVFIADVLSGMGVKNDLRLAIFDRLKADGISIPFPQRDLNVHLDPSAEPLARLAEAISGPGTTIRMATRETASAEPGPPPDSRADTERDGF